MTYSVWLFARPLSWADFIIALQWVSDGKYPLCHWGVLVTHLDITANDEFMRRGPHISTSEVFDLGIMYELRRNDINQNTVNVIRPFSTKSLEAEWRLFSAKYIGTTETHHDQIELEGTLSDYLALIAAIRITETKPNYQLFENNCQNFAKYLIEFMCPECLTPDTIQTLLQRWQDSTVQPSGRIPGTYPASVVTILSSPDRTYVTANESFDPSTRRTDRDPDNDPDHGPQGTEWPHPPSMFSFGM